MAEPVKKTLYHSALVQMGPTTCKVVDEEKESSKKKGSFYVTLEIEGQLRYYISENEACGKSFAGQKGKTITIVAEGSREEAKITIVGAPASQLANNRAPAASTPPPARGQQQPPSAPTPTAQPTAPPQPAPGKQTVQNYHSATEMANMAKANPVSFAREIIGKNRSLSVIALQAMEFTVREFERVHLREVPPELQVAIYTSMLYGCSAKGAEANLPVAGVNFTQIKVPHPSQQAQPDGEAL